MSQKVIIDKLYLGLSGQPEHRRHPGTVEDAVNIRFDPAYGAVKRNATELIETLLNDAAEDFDTNNVFWFGIQDAIVAIIQNDIYGWKLDGTELTVTDNTTTFDSYLASTTPADDIDVAVAFDTAIILNRTKVTAVEDAWSAQQYYNHIVTGDYTDATHGTSVSAHGTTVSTFEDLPTGSNGLYVRVTGDFELDPAGWYIYYSGSPDAANILPRHGSWYRMPKPSQGKARYTPSTMPHKVVYDASADTLTFDKIEYQHRLSGVNYVSNPEMPWVGTALPSIEFHSGRLFFLGADVVTSSRANDFFNLFNDNVNDSTVSDPINIDVSQSGIGDINRAVSIGNALFLDCLNGQLQFYAGENQLTNINGRTAVVGDIRSAQLIPAAAGNTVQIMSTDNFVHNFSYSDPVNGIVHTGPLNRHIPDLFSDESVRRLFTEEDTLYACTGAIGASTGYTYTFDRQVIGDEAIQDAWGKLETYGLVNFVYAYGDYTYLIEQDSSGYSLLRYRHASPIKPTNVRFSPRLDRMELASGSYDSATGRTTFTHSDRNANADTSRVVLVDANGNNQWLVPQTTDGSDFEVKGDYSSGSHYIGYTYDTSLELSDLWVKEGSRRPRLHGLDIFYFESTDFDVAWTLENTSQAWSKSWQAARPGVTVISQTPIETGYATFGVLGDARRLDITLSSDSPGPLTLTKIEFTVTVKGR